MIGGVFLKVSLPVVTRAEVHTSPLTEVVRLLTLKLLFLMLVDIVRGIEAFLGILKELLTLLTIFNLLAVVFSQRVLSL